MQGVPAVKVMFCIGLFSISPRWVTCISSVIMQYPVLVMLNSTVFSDVVFFSWNGMNTKERLKRKQGGKLLLHVRNGVSKE